MADRNILFDKTMVNGFRPFGAAMANLNTGAKTVEREDGTVTDLTIAIDKHRRIDAASATASEKAWAGQIQSRHEGTNCPAFAIGFY
jgi:hypothetical protein